LPTVRKNDVQAAAEKPLRRRILDAAFAAFSRDGYAATSTLDIATGAKVSKRELYATVGNKQELLIACIQDRALRLAAPADLPAAHDRESLERVLVAFGEQQLGELCRPNVIAMFRLAIAEAERTPEIAQALDGIAREASRARVRVLLEDGRAKSLLVSDVDEMSDVFRSLLFGDVMIAWLLGTKHAPNSRELKLRAQRAAWAFMRLYAA
jgi:AcrR family transcriptional regulator